MGYSVTAIYWDYKKTRKNIYPIKILVTVNGEGVPIHTPHKVSPNQWDNEIREVINHPNKKSINADISRRINEKETELLVATRAGERITKDLIRGIMRDTTLSGFAKEIAKKVINKEGETQADPLVLTELNRVADYQGREVLLSDVDITWLRKYNDHEKDRGMKPNTRCATFKWMGRVFKQAKKEGLIRQNPFDEFDKPRYEETDPVYLVEEEKAALFNLLDELQTASLYNTLVYFLFACYAGPRHSDWRKFHERDMIYDGFLRLRPQKKSKGFVVLPVGKTLAGLLQRIRDLNEPPYKITQCIAHLKDLFALAKVDMKGKIIQGIPKKAGTHVARHSFGYMCASLGLPKSTTAELMGISVQTVEVYYHLTGENIIKQAAALANV